MQEEYKILQMKGLKKNKKLHVNSAAIVWLDFVLLNHESKLNHPLKQLGWQCRIIINYEAQVFVCTLLQVSSEVSTWSHLRVVERRDRREPLTDRAPPRPAHTAHTPR
ncbi:hypothetical protein ACJJTC_015948 [Scirpophaga incertulas]